MRHFCLILTILLLATPGFRGRAQAPAKGGGAGGVFLGRSGKPMKDMRLFLGQIVGDQEVTYARVKILTGVSAAADSAGKYEFKNFPPGKYTILYAPPEAASVMPVEISIKSFLATTKSLMPLMRGVELGTSKPYPDRAWGTQYTLVKGHTFLSEGNTMKIWNATVRKGASGPYLEIRRGVLWTGQIEPGKEIKFDAWSY